MTAVVPLNILVLHGMVLQRRQFSGVSDVELLFPRYDRQNRYLIHSCYHPTPSVLAQTRFDAILLTSTFLDWVAAKGVDSEWLREFGFIRDSDAVKIALPQDDYWFCEVRDGFYVDWGIDVVYPACPRFSWPELIPRFLASGRVVRQGFTTYVTDFTRALVSRARPWSVREKDVVYRARRRPMAPNRYGIVKGEIGERFVSALPLDHALRLDISTDPRSLIRGDAWYDFLADARSILGSNSGSSIRLRNTAVLKGIEALQRDHPDMSLDAVEQAVLPAADRNKEYTAISPRNVEAAALGAVQVLVPGPYGDFLSPDDHYIPLEEDCSNAEEVLYRISDSAYCTAMADRTRVRLLEEPALQATTLIASVTEEIRQRLVRQSSSVDMKAVQRRYDAQLPLVVARAFPGKVLRVVDRELRRIAARFR